MVLYYSKSKKTKFFAETLGEKYDLPVYELESDLNKKSTFGFMIKALSLAFNGKSYPVLNMPENLPNKIYICTPIWGGQIAAPVKYFLENANLVNIKINILLTASVPVEKYRVKAIGYLEKLKLNPGWAIIFATNSKIPPEKETILEQLGDML